MLTFKHSTGPSPIHGIGLFTDEDLYEEDVLWRFIKGMDIAITRLEFSWLPDSSKEYFRKYGWIDWDDGLWHLSVDGDKFINHSLDPNTGIDDDGNMVAIRDIPKGEEVTANYFHFDRRASELEEIMNSKNI